MSRFSFLGFQYGSFTLRKSDNKPTPRLRTNVSNERQRSSVSTKSSSQPKMEEMRWVFDKFDTNKDGKISREEYKSALKTLDKEMTEAEIAKTFKALDSDGDGSIDWKEFVEMFNMGADDAKKADIEGAFRMFDLDGNGKISAEELSLVLKKLGENCSLGACKKMVKGVDMDGDGLIDINEFTKMMGGFKNPST
ncbi:calmodulin-like protein 30 [Argentina anserina]|uniref:calmodulin-like protein 30 n=1 Tax=Argentina anserina TaxID=57926 RepID=UPI00217645ED|nr:calmodulin-like protein 30 [Potentilla anserina]